MMIKKLAFVLFGIIIAFGVTAAAQNYPKWHGTLVGIADYNGNQFGSANPMPVAASFTGSVVTAPAAVKGFGTLAATSASTALSTVTAGPNSAVWPTSPAQLYVINSPASAGTVYVCPLGGTCSASVGIPVPAGGAYGFYQAATGMTVFAASTATVVAQW
jgi:hypothetical protein